MEALRYASPGHCWLSGVRVLYCGRSGTDVKVC